MTTEYKLNTLIEWTDEDRAKGECPVPDGSVVTVWFENGDVCRDCSPQHWDWGEADDIITDYVIHSVPREPLTLWYVKKGTGGVSGLFDDYNSSRKHADKYGGRVFKMVEVME